MTFQKCSDLHQKALQTDGKLQTLELATVYCKFSYSFILGIFKCTHAFTMSTSAQFCPSTRSTLRKKKHGYFWSPLGDDDEAVSQKESIHSTIPSVFWEVKKFIGNPVSTCILEFRSFAMLSGHDVRLGLCARRSLGVHFAGPMSPTIGNDVTLTTSLLENCEVNHRYVVISCTNVTGMYRE